MLQISRGLRLLRVQLLLLLLLHRLQQQVPGSCHHMGVSEGCRGCL
jgi:hypothetical protein